MSEQPTTYPYNDGEHIIQAPIEHASEADFDAWLEKEAAEAYAAGQTTNMTQDGQYVGLREIEEGVGYFAI